ncbi:metallophosphoesterase [Roseibium sediminicola]|uniref:Metallophosphoesterase n=1 Tax=Roseibium sediminicola TaxID=2933272 RepID=A0ABT0GQT1_9HYPH|nr:metallophosphoesterase [Roseibium sp. CAU 1639]MCK7611792.1 metallophosphoesterase [Roseibium sp. CAU 1639]
MFRINTFATVVSAAMSLPLASALAQDTTPPLQPGPDEGLFLIVTDIHFDPFTNPALVPELDKSPLSGWPAILKSAPPTIEGYGKDAGFTLMLSALEAAAAQNMSYDYVLYTGDYLSHHFNDHYNKYAGPSPEGVTSFAVKTTQLVSKLLGESFGGIPVFGVLGNEDSACGDYNIAPSGAYLDGLANQWAKLSLQPQRFGHFASGGYYKVAHPTLADQDVIALNSVFWSTRYSDKCNPDGGDPGADVMTWLEQQLSETRDAGRRAQILMHVPPGIDAYDTAQDAGAGTCDAGVELFWRDPYLSDYLALMKKYAGTVDYSFSGHTHMDGFTVLRDDGGQPLMVNKISPSVSPKFGNNPAFSVFLYNRKSGVLKDSVTFYLTNLVAATSGAQPEWRPEYTYRGTYSVPDLSADSFASVAETLGSNTQLQQRFIDLYSVSAAKKQIDSSSWQAFSCALEAADMDAYKTCYCGGN